MTASPEVDHRHPGTAEPRCAVCGAAVRTPVLTLLTAQGAPVTLVRCNRCHLVQVNELPSAAELQAYYRAYSYVKPESWEVSPGVRHSLERLVESFEPYRRVGTLLEVGCGAGHLLRAAAERGWQVRGTELSEVAVERLQSQGYDVQYGHLPQLPLPEAGFDVVAIAEVVEHLRDPAAHLAACYRLLRPGGLLYLTTPNFASLSRRLLQERWRAVAVPEHLFYFSPPSVRSLLEAVGFHSVSVRTEGVNPIELGRGLRAGRRATGSARVDNSSAALLTAASRHRLLWNAKMAVNSLLSVASLGDALKVRAIK